MLTPKQPSQQLTFVDIIYWLLVICMSMHLLTHLLTLTFMPTNIKKVFRKVCPFKTDSLLLPLILSYNQQIGGL